MPEQGRGAAWAGACAMISAMNRHRLLALATSIGLVVACGNERATTDAPATTAAAGAAKLTEVAMEDIKYDTTRLRFAVGQPVTFRFTNNGQIPHDAFIGDSAAQADHEQEMQSMGTMDMGHGSHGDGDAVTVQPGESGELTYTFDAPGTYEIGCHQAGHYAAGMKIMITVD